MNLVEIFDQLAFGELSNVYLGGGDPGESGVVGESHFNRLTFHVNLGLTALHSRFLLKEGRLTLDLIPDQYEYQLASNDDVIKVEKVLTLDGLELPLNDATSDYSVSTPTLTKLRIPEDIVDQSQFLPDWLSLTQLEVVYRANHPKIIVGVDFDPSIVEVDLPETHLTALLYFIASRVNNPIGMTNEFHAGNSYAAKYEMACKELEFAGLQVDMGTGNTKLRDRGFA